MAENIVDSLFGAQPWQIQQQQNAAMDQQAMQMSGMDNRRLSNYLAGRAGGMLAGPVAEGLGYVNPAIEQAKMREQQLSGLDTNSSKALLLKAQQVSDPRLKFQLVQLAKQREQEESKMSLEAAKTTQEYTKANLDIAQAQKALRENPNLAVTEVGVPGKPGYMQRVLFDKTNPKAAYEEIGEPYLSSAAARQTFHVSTGDKVRSQIVTDNQGNSKLINLDTGEEIKNLGKIGKPSGAYEKSELAKKATLTGIQDAEASLNSLLGTKQNPGLLYKATGSGVGTLIDLAARAGGIAMEGDVANAKIQPLADAVLKIVPRFEGPQSDKDTASYKEAAGNLANSQLPIKLRIEAAKTIQEIFARRKKQFVAIGFHDVETEPTVQSNDLAAAARAELANRRKK